MDEQPVDWTTVRDAPLGPPATPAYGPPLPGQPYRRRRRTRALVLVAVLGVLLVGGASAIGVLAYVGKSPVSIPGVQAQRFAAYGSITVIDCSSPGYGDIRSGTQVVLTDEASKVLAVGELTPTGTTCVWSFRLPDVPAGGKFYGPHDLAPGHVAVHRAAVARRGRAQPGVTRSGDAGNTARGRRDEVGRERGGSPATILSGGAHA